MKIKRLEKKAKAYIYNIYTASNKIRQNINEMRFSKQIEAN